MLPVVALVGRPNVGKSTLFNRLTRSRDALVADQPGLTRDRQYGVAQAGDRAYVVVDTGGLSGASDGLEALMARQAYLAVEEADQVLFLVDARDGLTAADEVVADRLRRAARPVLLTVNKIDGLDPDSAISDFHRLGFGPVYAISASHGRGVGVLLERIGEQLAVDADATLEENAPGIRVAVLGRPNVGKSTLVNRLLGEDRVLVYDAPGTTRDSIFVPFERAGQTYTLIDTAGVRRRARIKEAVEKFSVIKALSAMQQAHVVLVVLDARTGVTDQDLGLLGHVIDSGRAVVLVVNKWDGLEPGQRAWIRRELDRRLSFLDYARVRFVSALHGSGVGGLFGVIGEAHAAATGDFPTPQLTRLLEEAVHTHPPPTVRGRRIKLRYAHQGGRNPPVIVVHGNQTGALPGSYRRYLARWFRQRLELWGTPVCIELKSGSNPFHGRPNPLTPRQQRKRKRLLEHAKRRGH